MPMPSEVWPAVPGVLIDQIRHYREINGAVLDPMSAYLLLRGMKTLDLRVQRQNESALRIAQFLESHPAVERVFYPGLESIPVMPSPGNR